MTTCKVWGHIPVITAQEKQREKDHRINPNLRSWSVPGQPLRQGCFYPSAVLYLLDSHLYNVLIGERVKSELYTAIHTMSVVSEEISDSVVREAPFHEEDI